MVTRYISAALATSVSKRRAACSESTLWERLPQATSAAPQAGAADRHPSRSVAEGSGRGLGERDAQPAVADAGLAQLVVGEELREEVVAPLVGELDHQLVAGVARLHLALVREREAQLQQVRVALGAHAVRLPAVHHLRGVAVAVDLLADVAQQLQAEHLLPAVRHVHD